jgi:hypothetical protein
MPKACMPYWWHTSFHGYMKTYLHTRQWFKVNLHFRFSCRCGHHTNETLSWTAGGKNALYQMACVSLSGWCFILVFHLPSLPYPFHIHHPICHVIPSSLLSPSRIIGLDLYAPSLSSLLSVSKVSHSIWVWSLVFYIMCWVCSLRSMRRREPLSQCEV